MTSPAASPPQQVLVSTAVLEKKVQSDFGEYTVWHFPVTRLKRNRAMEKAILAYKRDFPNDTGGGFYPSVFEEELVKECVQRWDVPGAAPNGLGWTLLPADSDLGDKISEAIGVQSAMESFGGKGKEVEEAKNF